MFEHVFLKDFLKVCFVILFILIKRINSGSSHFSFLEPSVVPIHKFKPLKGTTSSPVAFIGEYLPGHCVRKILNL